MGGISRYHWSRVAMLMCFFFSEFQHFRCLIHRHSAWIRGRSKAMSTKKRKEKGKKESDKETEKQPETTTEKPKTTVEDASKVESKELAVRSNQFQETK